MTWGEIALGDLLHVKHGYAFKSEYFSNAGTQIVLTPGNFFEQGGFKSRGNKDRFYTSDYPKEYLLRKGDLILAMTEQGEGLLGSAALIPKSDRYLHNQRLGLVQIKDEARVDKQFLYRAFNSPIVRLQISGSATGVKVKHTAPERIYRCKFCFPPLQTQQKIAAILSAYDDLIENNLQRIKLLEEMAQITYEEWFVRMKFPGHEHTPIDPETGLPEGWFQGHITDISNVNDSSISAKSAPDQIHYLDIASVNTGGYEQAVTMAFSSAPSRARRKLSFGDTIFSTVRPNRKTYSLILEDDPQLIGSTGFAVLTPKIQSHFSFVYLSVANQSFVDKAVAVAGGAAYPAINQKDFEKLTLTLPNKETIDRFSKVANKNFKVIGQLSKQNLLLKEARDILLPRLMMGMIDVEAIELPEALLARMDLEASAA